MESTSINKPTLNEAIAYFARLGTFVFGGPVVLCERMRKDLVEKRQWLSPESYSEGFALSQLAPGPLATQLAIYIGWVFGGNLWATVVGVAFVLPSLLMVFALACLYIQFGGLSWLQGAFYGVGASVIAIIIMSSYKLVTKTFKKDKVLWAIGVFSAAITAVTESENLWLFLLAGILLMVLRAPLSMKGRVSAFFIPSFLLTGSAGASEGAAIGKIFLFFLKSGAIVFGSGLAIVPFLHSGVVSEHHWLSERQFLDAVAVAMITPGPVVITVGFIGYLVAGPLGGLVAVLGVFLPCYFFVIVPAPHFNKIAKNMRIKLFVDGVTAAAIGAIAGAAIVLGKRAITDWSTLCLAGVTLIILLKTKRVPEPILILAAGAVGIVLY